jgi:hypothetical protein
VFILDSRLYGGRVDVNGSPVFQDGADLKVKRQAVRVLKALLGRPGPVDGFRKAPEAASGHHLRLATPRRDDMQQDAEDTRRIRLPDPLSPARRLLDNYPSLR